MAAGFSRDARRLATADAGGVKLWHDGTILPPEPEAVPESLPAVAGGPPL